MVKMSDWDYEDPVTTLNTQLNRSMVLMENVTENSPQQNKKNKSIKISTKANVRNSNTSINGTRRKSILKKPEIANNEERNGDENESDLNVNLENTIDTSLNDVSMKLSQRPSNLQELMQEEALTVESTSSILDFDDISDSEDIWIMDIPKTINPEDLVGQALSGGKSKFKIGEEKYCAINRDLKHNITCVFNTRTPESRYKTVNIKPAGSITIRKKLSSTQKVKPILLENLKVPFPENLRTRHPLFGVISESSFENESKIKRKKKK